MKHKHFILATWLSWLSGFHEDCPVCWVRRFQYGYRLDPIGYMKDRRKIENSKVFSTYEKLYILTKCKPIIIEYD